MTGIFKKVIARQCFWEIHSISVLQLTDVPSPLDSILEAVLTVSPKRQYLGMVNPTTPAHTEPK